MSKNALPYYKAYPRDFFEGTMGMNGELKGQYRLLIDAIYMKGGALPEDDRYIAGLLGISLRKWRAAKVKLVDTDKIFIVRGVISNKRANLELEITSKYRNKQAENGALSNKNKGIKKPAVNQPEPEPKPYITTLLGDGNVLQIQNALMEAAGDSVDPHSPDIAIIQTPLLWIDGDNPCDLELDVLPALRRVAARDRSSQITSWSYFKNPVMQARDERLAGNPKPKEVQHDKPKSRQQNRDIDEAERRNRAALSVLAKRNGTNARGEVSSGFARGDDDTRGDGNLITIHATSGGR